MRSMSRGAIRAISLTSLLLVLVALVASTATAQVSEERVRELRAMADRIQPEVERLRGLKFENEVPKGIMTREKLQEFILAEFENEMSDQEIRDYEKILAAIGWIPADLDLKELMINLYTEQVAGFYNPATKRLYLVGSQDGGNENESPEMELQRQMLRMIGTSEEEITMAHELTHALEDQHFELLAMKMDELDDDDRLTASKSLVEGTATVLMFDFLCSKMGITRAQLPGGDPFAGGSGMGAPGGVLDEVPEYIKQQLVYPYMGGYKVVDAIHKAGGWDAVNRAFSDPPASTEQVLHPEKYAGERDNPTILTLGDLAGALGEGWREVGSNTAGELGLQILFKEAKVTGADRVAAGWDGDEYAVFEGPDGQIVLGLSSVWDTVGDAQEFMAGYLAYLSKRYGGEPTIADGQARWTVDGKTIWVRQDATKVHAMTGVPADKADAFAAALGRTTGEEWKGGLADVGKVEVDTSAPDITQPAADQKLTWDVPEDWSGSGDTIEHPSGATITISRTASAGMEESAVIERILRALPYGVEDYEHVKTGANRMAGRIVRVIEFKGTEEGEDYLYDLVVFKLGETAHLIKFARAKSDDGEARSGWADFTKSLATE